MEASAKINSLVLYFFFISIDIFLGWRFESKTETLKRMKMAIISENEDK